jgi:hypothetical protein
MTIVGDAQTGCRLNLLYSGTRFSFTNVHGGIVDVPFSLVADTVTLPYTIPRTIWNYYHRPTSDWDEDKCLREYQHRPRTKSVVPKQADTP